MATAVIAVGCAGGRMVNKSVARHVATSSCHDANAAMPCLASDPSVVQAGEAFYS